MIFDLLELLVTFVVDLWRALTPHPRGGPENVGKEGDRDQVGQWKYRRWR